MSREIFPLSRFFLLFTNSALSVTALSLIFTASFSHCLERGLNFRKKRSILSAGGTIMDYDKLLNIAVELGCRLMSSGAEIYRVEESVRRLLQAYVFWL